jgi:hypothetical protein
MSETLSLSTKERQRLQVLGHLKHGKTTVVKAAAALGLSERQMYRVLGRFRQEGDHYTRLGMKVSSQLNGGHGCTVDDP